jgi:hypothetical protein
MPNKLIAVDFVCSRLCVLILNSGWFHQLQRGEKPRVSGNRNQRHQRSTRVSAGNISVVTNLVETGSVTVTEYLLTPWDVGG